jgi:WhiB family redox-sensing transcriptional regulator
VTVLAGTMTKDIYAWMDRDDLGCKAPDVDVRIFYFEDHFAPASNAYKAAQATAKVICEACPARTDCLHFAFMTDERNGIWGGFTTPERNLLRKKYEQ